MKTTQEIKFNNLSISLQILIIVFIMVLIALLLWFFTAFFAIQSQIDDLPKRVCHNETETIEVSCWDFLSYHIYQDFETYNYTYPEYRPNTIRVFNETIEINKTDTYEQIIQKISDRISDRFNTKCFKEITKEVCNIQ